MMCAGSLGLNTGWNLKIKCMVRLATATTGLHDMDLSNTLYGLTF